MQHCKERQRHAFLNHVAVTSLLCAELIQHSTRVLTQVAADPDLWRRQSSNHRINCAISQQSLSSVLENYLFVSSCVLQARTSTFKVCFVHALLVCPCSRFSVIILVTVLLWWSQYYGLHIDTQDPLDAMSGSAFRT
jgi:hypothetical protein